MRPKIVLKAIGILLRILGILMLLPGGVAAVYREPSGVITFALTAFITLFVGTILIHLSGKDDEIEEMGIKDGFALVAFGWLAAAVFGALPYLFLGVGLIDSLFESMSGFTTTGASILTEQNLQGYFILNTSLVNNSISYELARMIPYISQNLTYQADYAIQNASANMSGVGNATDALVNNTAPLYNNNTNYIMPMLEMASSFSIKNTFYGLLFWRSLSQWLGGMGIILLFIAILPKLGVAGRQLYKAEVPGPEKDALTPRIRQTATLLWGVYVLLSILEASFLVLAGMPLFDALCNTFTSMATGGFSPQAASIKAYASPSIEGIITIFMFLAGANFALHYRMMHGELHSLIKDQEFRVYTAIIIIATIIVMIWGGIGADLTTSFRLSIFQVVSMMTTTGFVSIDFDKWSAAGKMTLLLLMFIGGCAGSTGGAIKVSRIVLTLKYAYRELFTALHPKAVMQIKLGGIAVREEILQASITFIAMYMTIFAVACMILAAVSYSDPRMDLIAIISAVATTIGNVGPGLGPVGPLFSFAGLHPIGKITLMLCMWIGRLEIVTILVLMLPEFWKR